MCDRKRWVSAFALGMLAVGCTDSPKPERMMLSPAVASRFLSDSLLHTALSPRAPSSVLFVDASCQNSLVALEAVLSDPGSQGSVAIVHRPQAERDPSARLEAAALECASSQGILHKFVSNRLDDLELPNRPILLTAYKSGADSNRFLACLKEPGTVARVARQEAASDSARISRVPVLLSSERIIIGRDPVVSSLGLERSHTQGRGKVRSQ